MHHAVIRGLQLLEDLQVLNVQTGEVLERLQDARRGRLCGRDVAIVLWRGCGQKQALHSWHII
jgi:hypothetical protein